MGKKKKRQRNKVVFVAREGDREEVFLNYLQEIFDPEHKITIKFPPEKGGNSNAILDRAFHAIQGMAYAWFDEDDVLDKEHREELEKCWHVKFPENIKDREIPSYNKSLSYPIVIVSRPLSIEGFLIRLFDKNLPKFKEPLKSEENFELNKNMMKSSVKGIFGKFTDIEYYRQHLSKEHIMKKAQEIEELRLLLRIFDA